MDEETLYRIEYSIQRMRPGDDDYVEIGFGSSGAWADIDMAAHMIESDVAMRAWETSGDMPDPEDVLSDMQGVTSSHAARHLQLMKNTVSASDPMLLE